MVRGYTAKYTKIDSGYMGQLVEWPEVITEAKKALDDLAKDYKFHKLERELEEELGSVFEWWRIKFLELP